MIPLRALRKTARQEAKPASAREGRIKISIIKIKVESIINIEIGGIGPVNTMVTYIS